MKRGGVVAIGVVSAVSIAMAVVVQTSEVKVKKGVVVGVVDIGGLTIPDAQKKVRLWWESARQEKLTLMLKDQSLPVSFTPGALGVSIDDVETVSQAPTDSIVGQVVGESTNIDLPLKFKSIPADLKPVALEIRKIYGEPTPPKVKFVAGKVQIIPEKTRLKLDEPKLMEAVVQAVLDDKNVQLPLIEEPKRVTDEMLAQITDQVSEFKTRFSAGNRPRSSNIKLAASKINGTLLLPGEQFSYNKVVGQRTIKAGFKEAGVFVNGRHDTGVGGGICQVSTTLYNAALFANLKIVKRQNHSLPVPYVPVGRDATVNWGAQDLVIENDTEAPILLVSEYSPGTLTFRIIGKKVEGQEVKVISSGVKYLGSRKGTIREFDPSLKPGATRVKDSGSAARSVQTYRVVYLNGQKVKTEPLGTSYYPGGPTVIAYGPKPQSIAPSPSISVPTTTVPPSTSN